MKELPPSQQTVSPTWIILSAKIKVSMFLYTISTINLWKVPLSSLGNLERDHLE